MPESMIWTPPTDQDIARLERQLSAVKRRIQEERNGSLPTSNARAILRWIQSARRVRQEIISRQLFADPAWDMLLELYAAELEQRRVSTSQLCISSAVPATTALRWIDKLDQLGFLRRMADPLDARRVWILLSSSAREKMERYLDAICEIRGE